MNILLLYSIYPAHVPNVGSPKVMYKCADKLAQLQSSAFHIYNMLSIDMCRCSFHRDPNRAPQGSPEKGIRCVPCC